MPENDKRKYDADRHIADIYDDHETTVEDVALVRRLIGHRRKLKIVEPFCGTGRILIPLAEDGHQMIGHDASSGRVRDNPITWLACKRGVATTVAPRFLQARYESKPSGELEPGGGEAPRAGRHGARFRVRFSRPGTHLPSESASFDGGLTLLAERTMSAPPTRTGESATEASTEARTSSPGLRRFPPRCSLRSGRSR